ncbi:uncharacterized protein LOC101854667 [Aplysia californica]|uniref:Uncharacterized protein LOC101854667 n=1 Tax=Aplysia californica TaxID=6500 RepID=A0ABM0K3M0_APLCA|nr:uncharacterized protein LOC101854667 [Aplysia californica]
MDVTDSKNLERRRMSASGKNETNALTSALKHVFYIHKDIVADLKSKLDVVTEAHEKLKCQVQNQSAVSPSSCQSCVHLQEMNKTLQRHFHSRLKDKNVIIKHLENRLRTLGEEVDGGSFSIPTDETLTSEDGHSLLEDTSETYEGCEPVGTTHRIETPVSRSDVTLRKQHTKLQLPRQRKRRSRYEEHPDAKKAKVSPTPGEKKQSDGETFLSKVVNPTQTQLDLQSILVPETEVEARQFNTEMHDLVVPETLALDALVEQGALSQEAEESDLEEDYDGKEGQMSHKTVTGTDACLRQELRPQREEGRISKTKKGDTSIGVASKSKPSDCVIPSVSVSSFSDLHTGGAEDKDTLAQMQNNFISAPVHTRRVKSTPPGGHFKEPTPVVQRGPSSLRASVEGNVTITPNLSDMKTPETPASTSPRIFDEVKVSKDKSATPRRSSSLALQKRRPAPNSPDPALLRVGNNLTAKNDLHRGTNLKENVSPEKSLRQSTMTQAFHTFVEKGTMKCRAEDLNEQEQEEFDEAIQRSLQDCPASQNDVDESIDHRVKTKKSRSRGNKSSDLDTVITVEDASPVKSADVCKSPVKTKNLGRADLLKLKERSPNLPEFSPHKLVRDVTSVKSAKKDLFASKTKHTVSMIQEKESQERSPSILSSPGAKSKLPCEKGSVARGKSGVAATRQAAIKNVHQERSEAGTNFDETIAPNLLQTGTNTGEPTGDGESDEDEDFFTLPSLQSVPKRTVPAVNVRVRTSTVEVVEDENDEAVVAEDDDSDAEDETIAPSPQQSLPGQMGSQFASSLSYASRNLLSLAKDSQQLPSRYLRGSFKASGKSDTLVKCVDVKVIEDEEDDVDDGEADKSGGSVRSPAPPQSVFDSFDRVPADESREFAHVEVVRKHSERNKLQGFSCKQCHDYYKNSGLSEEEMQQKMKECSRHRDKFRPPSTPEHFWSLGFPDTAEYSARESSKGRSVIAPRPPRRRRKLEKKF